MAELIGKRVQSKLTKNQFKSGKRLKYFSLRKAMNLDLNNKAYTNTDLMRNLQQLMDEANWRLFDASLRKNKGETIGIADVPDFQARIKKLPDSDEYGFKAFIQPERRNRQSIIQSIEYVRSFLENENTTAEGFRRNQEKQFEELKKAIIKEYNINMDKLTISEMQDLGDIMNELRHNNILGNRKLEHEAKKEYTYNDVLAEVGKFIKSNRLKRDTTGGLTVDARQELEDLIDRLKKPDTKRKIEEIESNPADIAPLPEWEEYTNRELRIKRKGAR